MCAKATKKDLGGMSNVLWGFSVVCVIAHFPLSKLLFVFGMPLPSVVETQMSIRFACKVRVDPFINQLCFNSKNICVNLIIIVVCNNNYYYCISAIFLFHIFIIIYYHLKING